MSTNGPHGAGQHGVGQPDDVVVRKAERGWVVGDENVSDLTSAMVLADLFAADQADNDDTRLMEAVDENGAPRGASRPSASAQHGPAQQASTGRRRPRPPSGKAAQARCGRYPP